MLEVELPSIDLGDVRNKSRGVPSIFVDETREVLEELALLETTKCVAVDHEHDANMGF
jgi:hypothetical protein